MTGEGPSRWAGRFGTSTSWLVWCLSNTAVHQPANASAPTVIRAARLPGMLPAVTSRTRTFIRAGLFMSRPVPPPEIRAGYYSRCCCCGARGTRSSPISTCVTSSGGCRTRTSTVTRAPATSSPRTPRTVRRRRRHLGRSPQPPGWPGRSRGGAGRARGARLRAATVGGDLQTGGRSGDQRDPAVTELGPDGVTAAISLRRAGRPGHPRGRGLAAIGVPARGADRPPGPSRHRPDRRPLRDLACRGHRRGRGRRARDPGNAGGPAQRGSVVRDRYRQGIGRRPADGHRREVDLRRTGGGVRPAWARRALEPRGDRGAGRWCPAPAGARGGRSCRDRVHVRGHRTREGRALPARSAPGPAGTTGLPLLHHHLRPARRGIRSVRPLRRCARDPVGRPGHEPHRPAHPDRQGDGRCGRGHRRHDGVRLPSGAGERRGDRRRRRSRWAHGPVASAAAAVHGCPCAGRDAARDAPTAAGGRPGR